MYLFSICSNTLNSLSHLLNEIPSWSFWPQWGLDAPQACGTAMVSGVSLHCLPENSLPPLLCWIHFIHIKSSPCCGGAHPLKVSWEKVHGKEMLWDLACLKMYLFYSYTELIVWFHIEPSIGKKLPSEIWRYCSTVFLLPVDDILALEPLYKTFYILSKRF